MAIVKLRGFRELDKALSELPKATAKAVLRRVAKSALEPMRAAAESAAPRDQGNLQISIAVSEKRTRRAKGQFKAITGGNIRTSAGTFRRSAAAGVAFAMGPSAGKGVLNYATFTEFGTSDTSAQPFMRPAFDANAEGAIEIIRGEMAVQIGKATKRVAKRRGL
jgi:HK97 gp10 family phage protein